MATRTRTTNQTVPLTYQEACAWRAELFDGQSLRVPVEELKEWALDNYLRVAVLQAVYLDGLRGEGEREWQTPAWDFGRFAKAHPLLIDLDENEALTEIERTVGNGFW